MIAPGGSGIVIASQAGHMTPPLPAEETQALIDGGVIASIAAGRSHLDMS